MLPIKLHGKRNAAHAAKRCLAENAGRNAAPQAAKPMQRPDAEHIIDLQLFLAPVEAAHEDETRRAADDKCADGMEQVRAGADRNQPGQRAIVDKARIIAPGPSATRMPPTIAISEFIATSPEAVATDCELMTLKPNQPVHKSHEPSASHGMDEGGMPMDLPDFK